MRFDFSRIKCTDDRTPLLSLFVHGLLNLLFRRPKSPPPIFFPRLGGPPAPPLGPRANTSPLFLSPVPSRVPASLGAAFRSPHYGNAWCSSFFRVFFSVSQQFPYAGVSRFFAPFRWQHTCGQKTPRLSPFGPTTPPPPPLLSVFFHFSGRAAFVFLGRNWFLFNFGFSAKKTNIFALWLI